MAKEVKLVFLFLILSLSGHGQFGPDKNYTGKESAWCTVIGDELGMFHLDHLFGHDSLACYFFIAEEENYCTIRYWHWGEVETIKHRKNGKEPKRKIKDVSDFGKIGYHEEIIFCNNPETGMVSFRAIAKSNSSHQYGKKCTLYWKVLNLQ
ncbi:MAG: hypothetical protein AAF487_06555 [Bacteroidota bacterium]